MLRQPPLQVRREANVETGVALRPQDVHTKHPGRISRRDRVRRSLLRGLSSTRVLCYKIDMEIKLTAVFRKFPEGYAAFVEELPGANTQGVTLEEARANLKEAVEMVLQANRELAEESLRGADVLREPLATG